MTMAMTMIPTQNNGYKYKAVPTEYNGITFRSKLEARYAIGFDRLGLQWGYEGKAFASSDGIIYTPDFYLPELNLYFEVKGEMKTADYRRIEMFHSQGHDIVIGHSDGTMTIYRMTSHGDYKDDCAVAKCRKCGGVFFVTELWGWECTRCGAYESDHYIEWMEHNFFEAIESLK